MLNFHYPVICWWTTKLISIPYNKVDKWSSNKQWGAKRSPNWFLQWLNSTAPLSAMNKDSFLSTTFPTLFRFVDDSHSGLSEVISLSTFNLHFSDDLGHWTLFKMIIGSLYFFFCKKKKTLFSSFAHLLVNSFTSLVFNFCNSL